MAMLHQRTGVQSPNEGSCSTDVNVNFTISYKVLSPHVKELISWAVKAAHISH